MKRFFTLLTLLLPGVLNMTLATHAAAQVAPVPSLMNFQGRLTRPDGTPVADGTYSIRFSLHDALTGGAERWNQTVNPVTVRNGTFAVVLSGFPSGTFDTNLYLEVEIGSDAPLTPRQQMVSVAYAMKANSIADGAITGASIANGTITADKLAFSMGGSSWGLTGFYYRSINVLAGADINEILNGVVVATIAGGGQDFFGAVVHGPMTKTTPCANPARRAIRQRRPRNTVSRFAAANSPDSTA